MIAGASTFGVNGECSCIYRLIAFNDLPFFIDEYQIAHANLGEVLRERVQPEMVRDDRVSD